MFCYVTKKRDKFEKIKRGLDGELLYANVYWSRSGTFFYTRDGGHEQLISNGGRFQGRLSRLWFSRSAVLSNRYLYRNETARSKKTVNVHRLLMKYPRISSEKGWWRGEGVIPPASTPFSKSY